MQKMEIDFLGLNSSKYNSNLQQQVSNYQDFNDLDNQGIETFLSLSTSSSVDSKKKKKKKTCGFGYDKVIPSCSSSSNSTLSSFTYYNSENVVNKEQQQPTTLVLVPNPIFHPSGFRYDLNDNSIDLRNISQLPYCTNVYNSTLPKKADNTIYFAGNVSKEPSLDARNCSRGYTPTVAMARKATLARFLEKRLHRMNQARTSHFMGKSMNNTNSDAFNMRKNNGRHEQRIK